MSARIFIHLPSGDRIDPHRLLRAVGDESVRLCAGPGVRLRAGTQRDRIVEVLGLGGRVLVTTRPQPSGEELALLDRVASAIRDLYAGRIVTALAPA